MHNHKSHECKHKKLSYCEVCDVAYCEACGREWRFAPQNWTWTYTLPHTIDIPNDTFGTTGGHTTHVHG